MITTLTSERLDATTKPAASELQSGSELCSSVLLARPVLRREYLSAFLRRSRYNQLFSEIFDSTIMKDCLDHKSFDSEDHARRFAKWYREMQAIGFSSSFTPIPFKCNRCDRWHIAGSHADAKSSHNKMKRERCLTTKDLHLQMCRVLGISLEELQTRCDLSKIGISGSGAELIPLKPKPGSDHELHIS